MKKYGNLASTHVKRIREKSILLSSLTLKPILLSSFCKTGKETQRVLANRKLTAYFITLFKLTVSTSGFGRIRPQNVTRILSLFIH